jgi:hypothetical protein
MKTEPEGEPLAVVFFIPLPNPLPLPHESIYTFVSDRPVSFLEGIEVRQRAESPPMPGMSGNLSTSLKVWQVKASPPAYQQEFADLHGFVSSILPIELASAENGDEAVVMEQEEEEEEVYRTVIEAVTTLLPEDGNEQVSNAFDRCLASLADLFAAYRATSGELVPTVARERLPPVIPYIRHTLYEPPRWDGGLSAFLTNTNLPPQPQALPPEGVERLMTFTSVRRRGHPLVAYMERSLEARVALETQGDYGGALIHAQIAAEILLDGLLTLILWEEGRSAPDCAPMFRQGLIPRVKKHLAPRLGGDWDTKGSGPVGRWASGLAALRHLVVHQGYHPSRGEAVGAMGALGDLDRFLRGRMVDRRTDFKRTTLMFLGRPGLEREDAWEGEMEAFMETTGGHEEDWLATYGAWRHELDVARR